MYRRTKATRLHPFNITDDRHIANYVHKLLYMSASEILSVYGMLCKALETPLKYVESGDERRRQTVLTYLAEILSGEWVILAHDIAMHEQKTTSLLSLLETVWLTYYHIQSAVEFPGVTAQDVMMIDQQCEARIEQGDCEVSLLHFNSIFPLQRWMTATGSFDTSSIMKRAALRMDWKMKQYDMAKEVEEEEEKKERAVITNDTKTTAWSHVHDKKSLVMMVHHQAYCIHRFLLMRSCMKVDQPRFFDTNEYNMCVKALEFVLVDMLVKDGLPSGYVHANKRVVDELVLPLGCDQWYQRTTAQRRSNAMNVASQWYTGNTLREAGEVLKKNTASITSGGATQTPPWTCREDIVKDVHPVAYEALLLLTFSCIWDRYCTKSSFMESHLLSMQQIVNNEEIQRAFSLKRHGSSSMRRPCLVQMSTRWYVLAYDSVSGQPLHAFYEFEQLLPAVICILWTYKEHFHNTTECQDRIPIHFQPGQVSTLTSSREPRLAALFQTFASSQQS